MGYRRGFKTDANALALEVRSELDLGPLDPLNPARLAEHLAIPVLPLSSLVGDTEAATYLLRVEPEAFSAVTVFRGSHRLVVHNDGHTPGRQANNITHELPHGLLHHPPTPALDDHGCRLWDQNIEDEATWLAGALLMTEDAALHIVRSNMTIEAAAHHFGVSTQMVDYRLNMTGARTRVARARARRP